jgi:hypothetical protein
MGEIKEMEGEVQGLPEMREHYIALYRKSGKGMPWLCTWALSFSKEGAIESLPSGLLWDEVRLVRIVLPI